MKPAPRAPGTARKLFALSLSIALAMSGVGIIIPVAPSHIGRCGLASASTEQVALYVSLLAAGYALIQLLISPLWGRLSDSLGRQPLLAIGLIGFAVGQALCGLAPIFARSGRRTYEPPSGRAAKGKLVLVKQEAR